MSPAGICDGLPKESLSLDTIDNAAFDLNDLSVNKVLIGCPRTLKQLHRLRHHKVYPNKVYFIQVQKELAIYYIQTKLIESATIVEVDKAERRAKEVYDEYIG